MVMPAIGAAWFQVVPPCGGHLKHWRIANSLKRVSSRAPVWGASQSSGRYCTPYNVSSRAPVWGASWAGNPYILAIYPVSSRAPVWGASAFCVSQGGGNVGFKSCPRVGGIRVILPGDIQVIFVSSRAPVWGASGPAPPGVQVGGSFQVVPPCGGHHGLKQLGANGNVFQVVPPCGGHPIGTGVKLSRLLFQVVPPCGGHRMLHSGNSKT